jgi:tetratricopeptide (TPR) repeat protein
VEPGRTLCQRYVLERELGRGSVGVVFAGRDHLLEREVAIKLIDASEGTRRRTSGSSREAALRREAKLAGSLDHPGIVPVFDFGRDHELLFLVMPLLRGQTLDELIAKGPLPISLAAEVARQAALALAYSHARGVVHRDVKPSNLMLAREGGGLRVKVMDFGLASIRGAARERGPGPGSLPYLAPESAGGDAATPRSDLYALGAFLYEAVVGRPPFTGDFDELLDAVLHAAPVPPGSLRGGLPREFESVILALLAKDPARRPGNGRELAELLEPWAETASLGSVLGLPPMVSGGLGNTSHAVESGESWTALLHDAVGRDQVLRTIDSRLIAARAGAQQLIMIRGEAGIGKTTLLDELALACQQREVELLRTSATSNEVGGWLGPFGELLTAGLAQRPEAVELLASHAARLVDLFPSLARSRLGRLAHIPKRESSWVGLEGVDRRTVARALERHDKASKSERDPGKSASARAESLLVRAFGALVANSRPITLAIDDAHRNAETVEMIDVIFRRLPHAPLVFVVTYESAELRSHHPIHRLARRLAQHPRALCLTLEPLEQEVHETLIHQLLGGGRPEPGLAEQLYRESGGLPLYARELVRTALESGVLVQRDGVWRFEAASWPIPGSLRTSITARLRRLPSSLVAALRTGAVLAVDGDGFDLDELVELVGQTKDELEHLLSRAIERRLLDERRGGGRITLSFTSELLRRVIHEELRPHARRKLHHHCAERLRRLPFSEEQAAARSRARLAHLLAGQAVDEVRPLIVELAHGALEDGRPELAHAPVAKLLELADSLAVVERAELLLLLAELEQGMGRAHAAVAALQRLASMLDHGDEARLSRLAERGAELAKSLDRRSLADRLLGLRPRDRRAAERQRRARAELAALRPATSSRSMEIGDLLLMHGEYTAAREAYDNSRRRAAADGDRNEEARQLQKLARVASKLGHYETAITYCRDGLELLAGKHSLERVGLWALAAFAHCVAGYLDRAEAELEAGTAELATFPEQRSPDRDRVAAELERSRGNLMMARGEPLAAIEAYERCLSLSPATDRWTISVARVNLGRACALAGQTSRALRDLERATADKRALGDRWGLVYTLVARVQVLRDLGHIEDAGELLDETRELADEIEDARLFALVHTELGRHALLSGKLDLAAQEARRAKDMARSNAAAPELGAAYELLASVDLARGELGEARRHAAKAVATAELHKLDDLLITSLLVLAEASPPERRPELLERAREASEGFSNPYRELDVSLTSLRLGLGDPNHAGDDYVALEQLSDRAESLSAQRHVGLCLLAQADVLAPHDLRGALDHARLGEAQLRVLGAVIEADRAAELVARLTLR